jgi:hypothetical protein
VLAAGDERAFATYATELLRSGDRLGREAALAALLERPLPAMRELATCLQLRRWIKRDRARRCYGTSASAGPRRATAISRSRGERLSVFEDDLTWTLRVLGIRLADLDPSLFRTAPSGSNFRHRRRAIPGFQLLPALATTCRSIGGCSIPATARAGVWATHAREIARYVAGDKQAMGARHSRRCSPRPSSTSSREQLRRLPSDGVGSPTSCTFLGAAGRHNRPPLLTILEHSCTAADVPIIAEALRPLRRRSRRTPASKGRGDEE